MQLFFTLAPCCRADCPPLGHLGTLTPDRPPYNIRIVKYGAVVEFYINDLHIFEWHDDGKRYGPMLQGGKIGFRQMAPLIAEYANLKIASVERQ